MNFLFLIINFIYRIFILFWYILAEIVIFSIIYKAMIDNGMPILAEILGFIFIFWLIADLIITIFIKTGKSFINYLINI